MEEKLPSRKNSRLKHSSYSHNGEYFITICAKDRKQIFGRIAKTSMDDTSIVGDGVLDVPKTELSLYGKIVEKYIIQVGDFYEEIKVVKYVIMPDHIHLILKIQKGEIDFIYPDGTSRTPSAKGSGTSRTPSPTNYRANEIIPRFVSTFKRFCNKEIGHNVFQRSYYDHVIRDEDDLSNAWGYIISNPAMWDYEHNKH